MQFDWNIFFLYSDFFQVFFVICVFLFFCFLYKKYKRYFFIIKKNIYKKNQNILGYSELLDILENKNLDRNIQKKYFFEAFFLLGKKLLDLDIADKNLEDIQKIVLGKSLKVSQEAKLFFENYAMFYRYFFEDRDEQVEFFFNYLGKQRGKFGS